MLSFQEERVSIECRRTDLLERIGSLYRIEDEIRGAPPDVRRRGRLERTTPLIEALRTDRRTATPLAQVRDGQGHRLWPQALDCALAVPRRRSAGDRQQHRRTRDPQHRDSAARTGCSPDRRLAVNAPPRSTPSSRPASSAVSSRRLTSLTSSPKSLATGLPRAGTSSCVELAPRLPDDRRSRIGSVAIRPSSVHL